MDVSKKVRESNRNTSLKRKNNSNVAKKNHRLTEKELEQTTRIRIDQNRLEDSESLDTSFLEGRLERKVRNNRFEKEKILNNESNHSKFYILKRILLISFLATMILFIIIMLPSIPLNIHSTGKDKKISTEKEKVNDQFIIDDNYLFVGDYHTVGLDLDQFSFPKVKVCEDEYQTKDLLDDMNHKIYQYNPSVVILEIGINDLRDGEDEDTLISNYRQIIEEIQENRPYAKIIIESLYPFNSEVEEYDSEFFKDEISMDDIQNINTKINQLAKDMDIVYLNVNKELSDGKQLKEKYTEDGIHLNDIGYQKIYSLLEQRIEDLS